MRGNRAQHVARLLLVHLMRDGSRMRLWGMIGDPAGAYSLTSPVWTLDRLEARISGLDPTETAAFLVPDDLP